MATHRFLCALFVSSGFVASVPLVAQGPVAGFQTLRFVDDARSRPIQLDVWYPATAGPETAHDYGISEGRVALRAPVAEGRWATLLLSHGALGAATNYGWLGEHLARSGFIVVGVSHFGESPVFGPETVDPETVGRLDVRARDLQRALDFVSARPPFGDHVAVDWIGAIGHSSGGATVAVLGGAAFSPRRLAEYCASGTAETDRGCWYPADAPVPGQQAVPASDNRIRALVLLDPALGPGFDATSLASVDRPTLVVGSVRNDFIPFAQHAGRYGIYLPAAQLVELDSGEGHFVYLDRCSSPIEVMGIALCRDRPGIDRDQVHRRLEAEIVSFLRRQFGGGAG